MKNTLIIISMIYLVGCSTVKQTTYYDNGKIKSKYEKTGFTGFSEGNGKEMPLSHISLIGK
jgi:uncharacterized protein YceK